MDFTGQTALATGAASGMGLLFSQCFAKLGGNVVMCDVNEAVLSDKVKEINAEAKGRAAGILCDVRDYGQVCAARDAAVEAFGRIDILQILLAEQPFVCAKLTARPIRSSPMYRSMYMTGGWM